VPYKDKRKSNGRREVARSWFLNIIVYGPPLLEDAIGAFFSEQHIYLQDPLGCDRRVVYRNPHIFQPETGHEVMTDGIEASLGNLEIERLEIGPGLLEKLMEDEVPLTETEAPPIIQTALFPWVERTHISETLANCSNSHQKQALTFMLRREQGWAMDEASNDIWTKRNQFGVRRYQNNITGACHDIAPPPFQGGLLADEMGLGKTLSMICLIATNQAAPDLIHSPQLPEQLEYGQQVNVKSTLLIVPPPRKSIGNSHNRVCTQLTYVVIQSWQKQLQL
jgi:SWI/SNF-related matrix-associated actin-dependent regulator of chromatin subfamily A3